MLENQIAMGGWSQYQKLSNGDLVIFKEGLNGLLGVDYRPMFVSIQIVAGVNYRFKCEAKLAGKDLPLWEAIIEIFAPINETPYVVGIHRI